MSGIPYWRSMLTGTLVLFALVCGLAGSPGRAFRAKVRAAGYPATCEEVEALLPATPAGRNAAPIYRSASRALVFFSKSDFEDEDTFLSWASGKWPAATEPIPQAALNLMARHLKRNAASLSLFHEAAQLPECQFTPAWMACEVGRVHHDSMASLYHGASLLMAEAVYCAATGEAGRGANAVLDVVRMSHALEDEPDSQRIRSTLLYISYDALGQLINRTVCVEDDLAALQRAFSDAVEPGFIARAVLYDFAAMNYDPDAYYQSERFRSSYDVAGWVRVTSWARNRLSHWSARQDFRNVCGRHLFRATIGTSDLPYRQQVALREGLRERAEAMPRSLRLSSWQWRLGYHYITMQEALVVARIRIAEAVLAVERYRLANDSLPSGLNALVPQYLEEVPIDPFSDEPLLFRKTGSCYIVYSVNLDCEDDGGIQSKDMYNGDITFTVERPAPTASSSV